MAEAEGHFTIGTKVAVSVRPSPIHGFGVFAEEDLKPNQVVEICATVYIPPELVPHIDATPLAHYVYPWGDGNIAVLGYGMIYNHEVDPNCRYTTVPDERFGVGVQVYATVRPVAAGEELTVNYSGELGNPVKMWWDED